MTTEKVTEWTVGSLRSDGTVAMIYDKKFARKEYAEAFAADKRREKRFMSFIVVPAKGPW